MWNDLALATLLRAVYSERQLYEVMVGFWSDHFNIDHSKGDCQWLKTADDREVVRKHALGSFPEMLRASDKYPSVCAISLHHFIMGQPHRLHHLRRAFSHIAAHRDDIWITTPGEIARHYASLPQEKQVSAG